MAGKIHLPLLGERTYLHSTTVFNALVDLIPDGTSFVFKLNRLLDTDTLLVERESIARKNHDREVGGSLIWDTDKGRDGYILSLLPNSDNRRKALSKETDIQKASTVSEGEAIFILHEDVSFVEVIVHLNKLLLQACFPDKVHGKWVFSRLDADFVPARFAQIKLSVAKAIGGARIVKSNISVDGSSVGDIYFNWASFE